MKFFALAAGVLGVPVENDYVPLPMVIGGTQVSSTNVISRPKMVRRRPLPSFDRSWGCIGS